MSAGFDAGNEIKISINDQLVVSEVNTSGHYRGIHVVIVNPATKGIVIAKVFDTYKSGVEFDEFLKKEKITKDDGYIVVATCMDDCWTKMSNDAKMWFVNMGSKAIIDLKYR